MEKGFSENGRILVIRNGYKFRFERKLKSTEEESWRCTVKSCKGSIFLLEEGNLFSREGNFHNHEPIPEQKIRCQYINNSVKRKAIDNIDERPAKLIHKEIGEHKIAVETLTRKDVKLISNSISRQRTLALPKLPKSSSEVFAALGQMEVKTIKEENFLIINDEEKGITVFSCKTNLEQLCNTKTILMDGTFEYCTKYFTQLFTIHSYTDNKYIPLVYCLLKDKKKKSYTDALDAIRNACAEYGLQFQPECAVVDFEEAIHGSLRSMFPAVKLVGCRFHLSQAWWRKIQKLGLTSAYRDNKSEEGKWLRYCFGLTYLNPNEVDDAFCDLVSIQPSNERLSEFSDYLLETYIGGDEEAMFPPELWASATADLWRTTNACEAFHSKFKSSCSTPHPNIFVFIKCLINIQTDTYILLNSSGSVDSKDKSTRLRKEFINNKLIQYTTKVIDRLQFVKCVSHKIYLG